MDERQGEFDWSRTALQEQGARKRLQSPLEVGGARPIADIRRQMQLSDESRRYIGEGRYSAMSAGQEERRGARLVGEQPDPIGRKIRFGVARQAAVAPFDDPNNIGYIPQPRQRLRENVNSGPGRVVLDQHRETDGIRGFTKMPEQAFLTWTVVIRRDDERRRRPGRLRRSRQFNRRSRAIAARRGDDRYPAACGFDGDFNQPDAFSRRQGRRLANGAANDNAIPSLVDLPIDELGESRICDSIVQEGSDQRGENAAKRWRFVSSAFECWSQFGRRRRKTGAGRSVRDERGQGGLLPERQWLGGK